MSGWLDTEHEIDAAPWCKPKRRQVAPGVYVTNIYGYHLIAALLHAGFRRVFRRQP